MTSEERKEYKTSTVVSYGTVANFALPTGGPTDRIHLTNQIVLSLRFLYFYGLELRHELEAF